MFSEQAFCKIIAKEQ